jgi:hypothetical protein
MLIDDFLAGFNRDIFVPNTFGVNESYRTFAANAKTTNFGSVNSRVNSISILGSFFEELPGFHASLCRTTFVSSTQKNMPLYAVYFQSFDNLIHIDISGF